MIAVDANKSNSITTFDIVLIRRLILQLDDTFQNNTSWRFVDMDYNFPDPTNPWLEEFPEVINAANMPTNTNANFVGIKIGDVNGSASPNSLLGVDTRTFEGRLNFALENKGVNAGEEFQVAFKAKDFKAIKGYQFTLGFDNNVMTFVDLETSLEQLGENNFGLTKLEEGAITTSWNNANGIEIEDDEVLFTLTFKATNEFALQDVLSVSSRFTESEAYNTANELLDIGLIFNGEEVIEQFELYQNTPNPFRTHTMIGFHLPTTTKATLTIYQTNGRVLQVIEGEFDKGYHEVQVNNLSGVGVLYYRLETTNHTATRKMIIIE